MAELKCKYVVVRFVDDPVRDEARNIGIILQCPEAGYFSGMFTPRARGKLAGVATPLDIELLQEYMADFAEKFHESEKWQASPRGLFEAPEYLQPDYLEALSENGFDKIVFSKPKGILTASPTADLHKLFERFVEAPIATVVMEAEKPPSEFRSAVEATLKERNLLGRRGVRSRYAVEVKQHKFTFDFGYKARREVLIETVDLTSEMFQVRLRHFSPTAIKFKLVKEDRPNTSRIALLRTPGRVNRDLRIEHDTLREFATEVVDFEHERQKREQILERLEREITGGSRLC